MTDVEEEGDYVTEVGEEGDGTSRRYTVTRSESVCIKIGSVVSHTDVTVSLDQSECACG